jgi:DinB superfamily
MMEETDDLIAEVAAARQRVIAAISDFTEEQATWKPAADAWSVAQVVEHLVLAEHGGIIRIWQAADALRRGAPIWQGEAVHRGRPIEAIIATTWREREDAPANAMPQTNGPLAYWIASFAACQPVLDALGRTLDGLDLSAVIAPHVISGPLDACQRLEFLRWHMDHHRQQIAEIIASWQ